MWEKKKNIYIWVSAQSVHQLLHHLTSSATALTLGTQQTRNKDRKNVRKSTERGTWTWNAFIFTLSDVLCAFGELYT